MQNTAPKVSVFSVLRLLTPLEIERLSEVSSGMFNKRKLTLVIAEESNLKIDLSDKKEAVEVIQELPLAPVLKMPNADQEALVAPAGLETEKVDIKVPEQNQHTEGLTKEEILLENAGIQSNKTKAAEELNRQIEEKSSTPTASLFIMAEKEKLKGACRKLKMNDVFDLYKKNNEVKIIKNQSEDEEMLESDEVGILINKRHY